MVCDLEHLVETKLAKTLHGVPEERGRPTLSELPYPGILEGHLESLDDAAVLAWIHLDATLDEVKWDERRMGCAAADDPAKTTESKVLWSSQLAADTVRTNSWK